MRFTLPWEAAVRWQNFPQILPGRRPSESFAEIFSAFRSGGGKGNAMMQRSIQEIRPAGKPGAVRSVLWSACLALVFLAGSLLSLRDTWQQAAAATWWPALAAAAGIAVSEVSRRLRKQYAGASRGIRLGSWGTVLVLTGFSGALEGL